MVSFVMKSQRKEVCGEGNKVWLLSTRRRRYMWAHKIRRYPIIIRLVISWTRPETGGVSAPPSAIHDGKGVCSN